MKANTIYEQMIKRGRITPEVAQQRIVSNMKRSNELLTQSIASNDIRGIVNYSCEISDYKNDLISLHQYIMATSDQVTNN